MISENLTYKTGSRTFEDQENKHRIRLDYTHGAMKAYIGGESGYIPTTWAHVSYVPNETQDIKALIEQVGGSVKAYEEAKQKDSQLDSKIRKQGLEFGYMNTGTVGEYFDVDGIKGFVEEKLGSRLSQGVSKDIEHYMNIEMGPKRLEEAQKAFERTGGKSVSVNSL